MAWQGVPHPFVSPLSAGPNPAAAAMLGLIPGVGAMYNGQFFKGFIHVIVFAVLVSMSHHYHILGLFIAAWILYQSFEAYHTARARQDGQPLPDPLGLNEFIHSWLNLGRPPYPGQPTAGPATAPGPASGAASGQVPAGYPQSGYPQSGYPPAAGAWQPPYQPYQPPYAGPIPPPPPVPPLHWRRREPIAAVVLIAMGVLFLLNQWDIFSGRLFEFTGPVVLIALGAWLIIRRLHDSQGGSQ
jgi:TM2 domain-containing membrane protein YozV